MYKVSLTQNQVSLVDDADAEAVIAVGKWGFTQSGYAVHYWKDMNGGRHTLYLHRFIYTRILGHAIPKGLQVDHKSAREQGKQARLDNQRDNLRLATASENQAAKGNQKNSTSGHKGISLRGNMYSVRLRYHHHRLHVGSYDNFNTAVRVYAIVHQALWGEYSSEVVGEQPLEPGIQAVLDMKISAVLHTILGCNNCSE